jgi:hypothetical protein
MGIFDDFDEAEESGRGKWYAEGVYLVRLRKMPLINSKNGKGQVVPIETTILETKVPYPAGRKCQVDLARSVDTTLPASNLPGVVCADTLLLERQQPALGNLKSAIRAFTNMTDEQLIAQYAEGNGIAVDDPALPKKAWKAIGEQATGGEGTMLAGAIAVVRVDIIPKKNKEPFHRKKYEAASAEEWAKYVAADGSAIGDPASTKPATAEPAPAGAGA